MRLLLSSVVFLLAGCTTCSPEFIPQLDPDPYHTESAKTNSVSAIIDRIESVTFLRCKF
jgi:hypothetical protein